ncbi:MAG: SDR family oxidoreductase [Halioglobus sp.]
MITLLKRIPSLLAGAVLVAFASLSSAETILVTGANSGIGFAFAEAYAAKGWTVIATHRRSEAPESLTTLAAKYPTVKIERMDVTDHAQIDALAKRLNGAPIDIIVNNAGMMVVGAVGDPKAVAAQQFGTLDYEQFDDFMHTNALGPIKIAEAFAPNIRASKSGKVVNISSTAGSISPPISPFREGYWYKTSKVALNMLMKNLAYDFKKDGIVVVMFHPGGVRTTKLKDVKLPLMEPAESVSAMIKIIDGLTLADSGKFLRFDGTPEPF